MRYSQPRKRKKNDKLNTYKYITGILQKGVGFIGTRGILGQKQKRAEPASLKMYISYW